MINTSVECEDCKHAKNHNNHNDHYDHYDYCADCFYNSIEGNQFGSDKYEKYNSPKKIPLARAATCVVVKGK